MKKVNLKNTRLNFFLKLLGIVIACFFILYLCEAFPRFITFSFPPPTDDYPVVVWMYPTYSVIRPGNTRFFTWNQFAILSYESIPEAEARQNIFDYFDQELMKEGWVQGQSEYDPEMYRNCYDGKIFSEALFLSQNADFSRDGYVVYRKRNQPSFVSSKENDEICLAVWRHWEHVPGVFNVKIFTIKPSPHTKFIFRTNFQSVK
jgi:hypothetical protein